MTFYDSMMQVHHLQRRLRRAGIAGQPMMEDWDMRSLSQLACARLKFRSSIVVIATSALMLLPIAARAQQIEELSLIGDLERQNDQPFTSISCPAGNFANGIIIRQGEWLDRIELQCVLVSQFGKEQPPYYNLSSEAAGGKGGTHKAYLTCPRHAYLNEISGQLVQVARGIPGLLGGGVFSYLAQPGIQCSGDRASPRSAAVFNQIGAGSANTGKLNNGYLVDVNFEPNGELRYVDSVPQRCSKGWAVTSMRVSIEAFSNTIKAIGLNCMRVPDEIPSAVDQGAALVPTPQANLIPSNADQPTAKPSICKTNPAACRYAPHVDPMQRPTIPNQPN